MEFLSEIHPMVVHFPVALFITYFLFECLSFFNSKYESSAVIILLAGIITGIMAVLSGNQAYQFLLKNSELNSEVKTIIESHEFYATLLLWYYFVILILRYFLQVRKKMNRSKKIIFIILGLIGIFLVIQTGNLGGKLVFEHGIGVNK